MKNIIFLLTVLFLSNNIANAEVKDSDVADLFDQWNKALQTQDPATVTALYADDAILLPTVSNVVRSGHELIKDYFVDFLKLKPQGRIIERFIDIINDNTVADNGVYEFTLIKNGKAEEVMARYSFIYKKINGKWMILVHHSSLMPESSESKYRWYNLGHWLRLLTSD
jgi:uncharacterized protein (TIGR02246 family)